MKRCSTLLALVFATLATAQNPPDELRLGKTPAELIAAEDGFYERVALPIPAEIALEVGGILALPDKRLLVATRRGEIWWIDGAYAAKPAPRFTRFAAGLHEILGLAAAPDAAVVVVQRGEVTRVRDTNGDGTADRYEQIATLPVSGNFHEYAYGPVVAPDGALRVTLNLGFGIPNPSSVPWRGWMLEVGADGAITPIAAGMRSPAGFLRSSRGDWFYTENQGEWIPSGWVSHVERGDFLGHPASLAWSDRPESPVKVRTADVESRGDPFPDAARRVPGFKPPAVWFPQAIMGISTSDLIEDTSGGKFGPFAGQFFVGDQGQSKVMRMSLERVKGVYQGACYPFRSGFDSGVVRFAWGGDGSLFVGSTSRGWGSIGERAFALERVRWTGRVPFEVREITATPDGLRLAFTQPVDATRAVDPASYVVTGFTYKHHRAYGSPIVNRMVCPVVRAVLEPDRIAVRLVVACLREGYIHEVKATGVRAHEGGAPLLHDTAYYTMNRLPDGGRLAPAASLAELCGAPGTAPATPDRNRFVQRPANWPVGGDTLVRLRAQAGLKFDRIELSVASGARVALTLENADDMLHNWVLTVPGQGQAVGAAALTLGLDGAARHYVPPSPHVIAHTTIIAPGTRETIYFTAPEKPGDYEYVCSFPGHAALMRGVLRVE